MTNTEKTILIVDDEEDIREGMIYVFEKKGFRVLSAVNGNSALEIVKKEKIDIVISDIRMPDGDGVTLLKEIKKQNPGTPVVMFITGHSDLTVPEAYDLGAVAVLGKPFKMQDLYKTVERHLVPLDTQWSDVAIVGTTDLNVELMIDGLNVAIKTHVINIGRGGMFIAWNKQFPRVESGISFSIRFRDSGFPIEGKGIVRWCRQTPMENKPSGCGVEFQYLSDVSRKGILQLIHEINMKSFIPAA